MLKHIDVTDVELRKKIRKKEIIFGGNNRLKIYGRLDCKSGKRMTRVNRIFFQSETEAIKHGFRPCGHCMKESYFKWKNGLI